MVRILPFQGLRYNTAPADDLGPLDLSQVTAPPYDVIDAADQAALYAQHPYNVVRLILNQKTAQDSETDNVYTRAAQFYQDWQTAGILTPEPQPALYAYTQSWNGNERRGLIALLQLEPLDQGPGRPSHVLPHEHTLGGPKVDRLKLMHATLANLSQIFMIYADPQRQVEALIFDREQPGTEAGWLQATDADQVVHRFKPLTETALLAQVQRLFEDQKLLIADGHHRYETALIFQREIREQIKAVTGQEPAPGTLLSDYVMVFLTNMDDPGLKVYPTHRVLYHWPEGWDQVRFEQALLQHTQVVETGEDFIYQAAGRALKLKVTDPAWSVVLPEPMRTLDVALLEEGVFKGIFGQTGEALKHEHTLGFYRDEAQIDQLMASGEAVATFYMQAPDVALVRQVSEAGYRMPQKSTYFYPKLLSGLVFYPYHAFVSALGHALSQVLPEASAVTSKRALPASSCK